MKQFDLFEYNQLLAIGENPKIVTRNGKSVRIICTDRKPLFGKKPFYTIVALVEDGNGERITSYTASGCYYDNGESESDLFFADEKEEYDFKPFDKVLVRDCDEQEWNARFFEKMNDLEQCRFATTDGRVWRYCIPFEGNEELLGTTNEPKTK